MQYLGGKSQTARAIADLLAPADLTARVFTDGRHTLRNMNTIDEMRCFDAFRARLACANATEAVETARTALSAGHTGTTQQALRRARTFIKTAVINIRYLTRPEVMALAAAGDTHAELTVELERICAAEVDRRRGTGQRTSAWD